MSYKITSFLNKNKAYYNYHYAMSETDIVSKDLNSQFMEISQGDFEPKQCYQTNGRIPVLFL